ncbi:hypothetical protein [Veronia pacifica]|uniref:DUF4304 domain-containing protein n=1 Tax=Veronia pacifica TaxID=1080227 RepID=A0A1C3ESK5_9GAMM|nr:hypothetical protein [Veronia pacifica]ODA36186.1 hypothetical protein A8L45_00860 [Veronia pacifica]
MKLGELKKALYKQLGEALSPFGFSKVRQGSLYRKTDYGWQAIHVPCANYGTNLRAKISCSVRHDQVEDLVNELRANNGETKSQLNTGTVGASLVDLFPEVTLTWRLWSEDDIAQVVEGVVFNLERLCEPLFERFSTLEPTYQMAIRDDKESWLHMSSNAKRGMTAVALTILLDKPNVEKVISDKVQFMKKIEDLQLDDFLEFVEYMRPRLTRK